MERIKFNSQEEFAKAMIDNVLEDEDGCRYTFDVDEKEFTFIEDGRHEELGGAWDAWQTNTFTIVKKSRFPDKAYVWAWEGDFNAALRFWDAENDRTFTYKGNRNGSAFSNYQLFTGTPPKHMEEMKNKLED